MEGLGVSCRYYGKIVGECVNGAPAQTSALANELEVVISDLLSIIIPKCGLSRTRCKLDEQRLS
jgi:hypothetical protein